MLNYILDGKIPKPEPDIIKWAQWYAKANRTVKKTKINEEVHVSTVFLSIDHAYLGGEPILFETMIFGGEHDQYCERYATWEEAEMGHENAVNLIFTIQ